MLVYSLGNKNDNSKSQQNALAYYMKATKMFYYGVNS